MRDFTIAIVAQQNIEAAKSTLYEADDELSAIARQLEEVTHNVD